MEWALSDPLDGSVKDVHLVGQVAYPDGMAGVAVLVWLAND